MSKLAMHWISGVVIATSWLLSPGFGPALAQDDAQLPVDEPRFQEQASSDLAPLGPKGWVPLELSVPEGYVHEVAEASADNPLRLSQVLRSVRLHHPQVQSALARVRQADARVLAARGLFDPRLSGKAVRTTGGYYELLRGNVELRQPTKLWGTQVYAGYMLGRGLDRDRFPTYYPDETLANGELRAGIQVPLWRGGPIDAARASIQQRQSLEEAMVRDAELTRLQLGRAASAVYYRWGAAGHRLLIAERLLELAQARDAQLKLRQRAGSVSPFDVTDNLRMVVDRENTLIKARRAFQAASIDLGLFLRDRGGRPMTLGMDRLPPLPPVQQAAEEMTSKVRARIVGCHPRVAKLRAELDALQTERRLAQNQVAPDIMSMFEVSRDLGDRQRNPTLAGTNFELGVSVSVPLLLRTPRGELGAAKAAIQEKTAELSWVQDQVQADVLDVHSQLVAALRRAEVSARLVQTAEALALGERKRFDMGASALLVVNLREQAAAAAANQYIDSLADARTALYEWKLLTEVSC